MYFQRKNTTFTNQTKKVIMREKIIEIILQKKTFTIMDIAEASGKSVPYVSVLMKEFLREGLVEELSSLDTGRKGRRPGLFRVRPSHAYYLGVDVKAFGLIIGLMDFQGEMVRIERIQDFVYENTHSCFNDVCDRVQGFLAGLDPDIRARLAAINFCLGGRVDSLHGASASVFNFEETYATPLSEMLKDIFSVPVSLINDTTAMAYGEYYSSAAPGVKNVLFANVGWGLGLGIILDGSLYYGHNGYSGEMGHYPYYNNKILCHCGKMGCIETEVSLQAIRRKLIERIRQGENSILSSKVLSTSTITVRDILGAVEKEDPLCIELISWTGSELGRHLAGMINLFNPESIIIGGTLTEVPSYYFLQSVILSVRKYALRLISQNVTIAASSLGDTAGVVGACLIARKDHS